MACRICSSETISLNLKVREMMFGTRSVYNYFECSECGTVQIETPVTNPELLYPSNYYSFNYEKTSKWQNIIKMFLYKKSVAHYIGKGGISGKIYTSLRPNGEASSIAQYLNPESKILDIGCGTGIFIKALSALKYNHPVGIDPYIPESVLTKEYSILKVDLSAFMPESPFDLIMMHHSFEHMDNPVEVLLKIREILSEKGRCIIRIPVADSYAFQHYKENWVQLDAPRHVFLHTVKSITFLAKKCGLKVDEVIDDSTDFQIIGSEQYSRDIALVEPGTNFIPIHKKLLGMTKSVFDKQKLKNFKTLAKKLNAENRGDQKIFVLVK